MNVREQKGWFVAYIEDQALTMINANNAEHAEGLVRQMLLGATLPGPVVIKAFRELSLEESVYVGVTSILEVLTGHAVRLAPPTGPKRRT